MIFRFINRDIYIYFKVNKKTEDQNVLLVVSVANSSCSECRFFKCNTRQSSLRFSFRICMKIYTASSGAYCTEKASHNFLSRDKDG